MTAFDDLDFAPRAGHGGEQAIIEFGNGYGASVIRGPHTYGGEAGLFELAVLNGGHLTYDTPITEDVLGHLLPDDVTRILGEIEGLPAAE